MSDNAGDQVGPGPTPEPTVVQMIAAKALATNGRDMMAATVLEGAPGLIIVANAIGLGLAAALSAHLGHQAAIDFLQAHVNAIQMSQQQLANLAKGQNPKPNLRVVETPTS